MTRSSRARHAPVLGLGLAVVPGDAAGLPLDERSRHVARDPSEQRARRAAARRRRRRALSASGRPARERGSRARRRGGSGRSPNHAVERLALAAADDVHARRRERRRGRGAASRISAVGTARSGWLDELAERAVVVEQQRPSGARRASFPPMRARAASSSGVTERGPAAAREPVEPLEEALRPADRSRAARRGSPSGRGGGAARRARARAPRRAARPCRRRPTG